MTEREFDQSDARELAEFAGLEIVDDSGEGGDPVWVEIDDDDIWDKYRVSGTTWFGPWHWTAPRWQTQLLLDAVRDKGLEVKFCEELRGELGKYHDTISEMDVASAPPSAVCEAILSLEVE